MGQIKFTPKATQLAILQDINRQKVVLQQRENDIMSILIELNDLSPDDVINVELVNNELIINTK